MPCIRFTADPKLPRDMRHLGYHQGKEVDLSDDQADRWLRRGVAMIVARQTAPPALPVAPPALPAIPADVPAIPDDWEAMSNEDLLALATRIGGVTVDLPQAAAAIIAAEIERRALAV